MHIKQLIISGFRSFRSQNEIETFRSVFRFSHHPLALDSNIFAYLTVVRSTTSLWAGTEVERGTFDYLFYTAVFTMLIVSISVSVIILMQSSSFCWVPSLQPSDLKTDSCFYTMGKFEFVFLTCITHNLMCIFHLYLVLAQASWLLMWRLCSTILMVRLCATIINSLTYW